MKPIFDITNQQTPYEFYEYARKATPVFFDQKSGYWIVTKFEDVQAIMKDEAHFSARLDRVNYSDLCPEALSVLCPMNFQNLYGLSTTENPSHDKVKKVLMPAWNKLFSNNLKPKISQLVDSSLASLKGEQEFDILKEVFNPLPANIVFTILGIDQSQTIKVKEWSMSRLYLTWGDKSKQLHHAQNIVKYWNFCDELINQKMKSPGDDLPSLLLEAYYKQEITLSEIKLLCYGLIFSGHTTTSAFLAEALKVLLESGLWHQHATQSIPFSQSVDELLRLCPSAFTRRRIAVNDQFVGSHHFKKGDEILLVIGSANRDEQVFANPNHPIISRKNARIHLSLGRGFHYCIGARLVKLEYEVIMSSLMKTFPDLRLSSKNDFNYPPNISIRFLNSLEVLA